MRREHVSAIFVGVSMIVSVAVVLLAMGVNAPAALAWALGVGLLVWAFLARHRFRRWRIDRTPFPESWRETLDEYVRFYRQLEPEDRGRFERDVRYFVQEHTITGPKGAPVPDDLKVLVGASAAILAFGRPRYRYPRVRDVVVYADAFDEEYNVSRGGRILGQVGHQGPILFSARALKQGFRDSKDGLNVGLHELAHVLDLDDGHPDGVPSLMPWSVVKPWLGLMHAEASRAREGRSLLRGYAATNEAEFFAVATEAFFEKPRALRRRHPQLYSLLRDIYGQDPAERG